jgi:SAM-dependent methyltransferase
VKLPELNAKYWEKRYETSETGWDIGYVSTPLKTYFNQLKNKNLRILIPGAGNAYEAEYLVNNGYTNVYVCDLVEQTLKNLKKKCPAFKTENLLLSDFFELRDLSFDLIIEQTFFCALHPSLRKKYAEKMRTLLKPNGKLVGVLFNDPLNNDKPPFGGNKEEYLGYFRPLFKINTFEACYNSVKPREARELFINLEKRF